MKDITKIKFRSLRFDISIYGITKKGEKIGLVWGQNQDFRSIKEYGEFILKFHKLDKRIKGNLDTLKK